MVGNESKQTGVALEAIDLAFAYRSGQPVLQSVDATVQAGELVALFGPNGAGKSTLLRLLGGLLEPTAGVVKTFGRSVLGLPARDRARALARMPQGLDAWPDVRVEDLVWSARYCHREAGGLAGLFFGGKETASDRVVVEESMLATGCDAWKGRSVRELSGGERERVLLARALAQEAPVLLADEPTRSLDPEHQLEAFGLLREEARKGRAVLVVTHDWNLASQFADRLLCLAGGRVVAEGQPADVLRPGVLESIYGTQLHFGTFPGSGAQKPFVLPWQE